MQWRRALEQAQWQARARASTSAETRAGARDARGRADGADGADGAPRTPRALPAGENAPPAPARPASRGDSIAPPLARALERTLARHAAAPDACCAVPAGAAAPVRTGGVPASPAESAAPCTALPWAELPEWPQVVFHASASGARVSVGVRDAELTDADALALFGRLRSRLAQAGFELAGLVVNGHAVTPDDPHPGHA